VRDFTAIAGAEVQTLRSASISDENDDDEPQRVTPVINQEKVSNGHMQHVFPHESVTVITLRTRAGK
jgi:alpha-N-arabinofuranosidase